MERYAGFEPQVGEIRAVRTFRVGPGGVLYPLFSPDAWHDGANHAHCRIRDGAGATPTDHHPPDPDCSCGFYAYGSEAATHEYPFARHVLAVVACWGGVIAGTRGVRAEWSRIEALWLSDAVPDELVAGVAERYPSVALYRDRAALLAEHPASDLDCYEPDTPRGHPAVRRAIQGLVTVAVLASSLPASWLGGTTATRLVCVAALAVLVASGVILSRGRAGDVANSRRVVLFHALGLWLIAPIAGPFGVWFLRLPLLQLGAVVLMQRWLLSRAAARFPAQIA